MILRALWILMLCSFSFLASANESNDDGGYKIELEIEGADETEIYLARHYGDKQYYADTTVIKDGKAVFSSDSREGGLYLIVLDEKRHCEIILNEPEIRLRTKATDLAGSMQVLKSKENKKFYEFLNLARTVGMETAPLKEAYKASTDKAEKDALLEQITSAEKAIESKRNEIAERNPDLLYSAMIRASGEPILPESLNDRTDKTKDLARIYYYRDHYFDGVDWSDDRLLRTPFLHKKLHHYLDKLLIQKADSIIPYAFTLVELSKQNDDVYRYVLSTLASKYESAKIMGLDEVFVNLVLGYYNKDSAWWMDDAKLYKIRHKANRLAKCLIGDKGNDFSLVDRNGNSHRLYEMNHSYTLLYFYDPDCGHCKKETPKLKEFYENHKHLDLEVVAINVEVEIDKWEKYIDDNNLEWLNVADPDFKSTAREDYYTKTTPALFLLDKDKVILAKNLRSEGMAQFLENHLK